MGLDSVELVMAVEETFGIAIEDDAAAQMRTPAHIIEYVLSKAGRAGDEVCLTQRSFHRLRASLMRHAAARRADITPDKPVGELIPRRRRKPVLALIFKDCNVSPPAFVRSPYLVRNLLLGSIGFGCLSGVLWGGGLPFVTGAVSAVIAGLLGMVFTLPLRNNLPALHSTVGDLSRWLMADQPRRSNLQPRGWTREQVAEKVRQVVIEQLNCGATYREDARFIEDLGMD